MQIYFNDLFNLQMFHYLLTLEYGYLGFSIYFFGASFRT